MAQAQRKYADNTGRAANDNTRNVQIVNTASNDNYPGRQTTDEKFKASYAKAGVQIKDKKEPTPPAENDNSTNGGRNTQYKAAPPPNQKFKVRLPKKKKEANDVLTQVARAKVSALNIGIFSAAGTIWVAQAFFSVISLIFFGIASLVSVVFSTEVDPEDGVGEKVWKFFIRGVEGAFDTFSAAVESLTGFDLGGLLDNLDPMNFFFILHVCVMAIGITTLAMIYLIYTFSFIKSLSGEGEGTKQGALLLALAGYSIPLVNIFPWFIFWTMAVWRYPK